MSPQTNNKYPEFEPDQLLTNDHLNNLFGYLDSGTRLTRSRLVGIGIVCGLEVRPGAGGAITITRGCGVTSEGYLVTLEEDATYTHIKSYDPLTEHKYAPFFNDGAGMTLRELKKEATEVGITPITAADLAGKVVLLFVELLAEGAKNCDPSSCDDKGTTVTVNFLPLILSKEDAQELRPSSGKTVSEKLAQLPRLRMPRYDVPATLLADSAAVFGGYRTILSAAFLKKTQAALSTAYDTCWWWVQDEYPADPFASLASDFSFLHTDDLDAQQLLSLQYYYDLFSDLMLAHDELRGAGKSLQAECCPQQDLFPRHLLLGEATVATGAGDDEWRQSFIPSPALSTGDKGQRGELRLLFRRLVLLIKRFKVPPVKTGKKNSKGASIRITPSQWGSEPLSDRAIPFYYEVAGSAPQLFQQWNAGRTHAGTANQTLSYHAGEYNTTDDAVQEPLGYDLEPYDFLRIEGHIGQKMPKAMARILQLKQEGRLPFDVVALSADVLGISRALRGAVLSNQVPNAVPATGYIAGRGAATTSGLSMPGLASATTQPTAASKNAAPAGCHIQDLEALYDTLRAELQCILCGEMQYFYGIKPNNRDNQTGVGGAAPATDVPAVPILKECAPDFRFAAGTLGQAFEAYWPMLSARVYASPDTGLDNIGNILEMMRQQGANQSSKDALGMTLALMLLYHIEKLWEVLPHSLSLFDAQTFLIRYEDLMQVASVTKDLLDDGNQNPTGGNSTAGMFEMEDVIDHLDALLYACKDAAFKALYTEYLQRWMRALLRQRFGFFAHLHPGIAHKAGVPVGGTFILVYHEAEEEEDGGNVVGINTGFTDLSSAGTRFSNKVSFKAYMTDKFPDAFRAKDEPGDKKVTVETKPVEEAVSPSVPPPVPAQPAQLETVLVTGGKRSFAGALGEGDAKAQAYLEALVAARREDAVPDDTVLELLEDLPNGIVIADFCLPYLCCSDCPPMQFVLQASDKEEEPDEPPQEGCPPLADIRKDFEAFSASDKESWKVLEGSFKEFDLVRELFGALHDVERKEIEDQITYFTSDDQNDERVSVIVRITRWLSLLHDMSSNKALRLAALTMYHLLLRLLLYIDCIVRRATGKTLVAITRALTLVTSHVKDWKENGKDWSAKEKALLEKIIALLDAREATLKPVLKPS